MPTNIDAYSSVSGPAWLGLIIPIFVLLVFWSIFWKGWALWKAARQSHKGWFIALLILNTAGILEILYIFVFGKKDDKPQAVLPSNDKPVI